MLQHKSRFASILHPRGLELSISVYRYGEVLIIYVYFVDAYCEGPLPLQGFEPTHVSWANLGGLPLSM
jgi:hypothetical protein